MITVRYPDEPDPITYLNEHDRELFEAVKLETGATIREICAVGRAIILADLYPIKAEGPVFIWPKGDGEGCSFCWISPLVPAPDANCDVIEALNRWKRDCDACKHVLENDDSIEATVKVLRNTICWLKFWQVRARTAELRGWYAKLLEERLAGLAQLREKAFARGKDKILEALNDV
jgi:hypothetical protein